MTITNAQSAAAEFMDQHISSWPIGECQPLAFAWHDEQEESCSIRTGTLNGKRGQEEVNHAHRI